MILLAFDVESTGLDFTKDRVIEVGAILYSTGQQKCLESQGFLVKTDVAISPEITKLTGITQAAVDKFGYDSENSLGIILDMLQVADAVIGHNAVRFDKRMLQAWCNREEHVIWDRLWIDTYTDLPDTEVGNERAQSPTIVVQAHQARHENDLAKKAKFRWYPEKKMWWKFVKEMDLESFVKSVTFDVSVHRENIEEFQNL